MISASIIVLNLVLTTSYYYNMDLCLFICKTTCKVASCLLHVCIPVSHSIINLAPFSPPQ